MSPERTRTYRYAFFASAISCILLVCGTIFYVGWAIDQNNQRTCRLYYLIYQPTSDTPLPDPSDPKQKRAYDVRQEIGHILKDYHCKFSR